MCVMSLLGEERVKGAGERRGMAARGWEGE